MSKSNGICLGVLTGLIVAGLSLLAILVFKWDVALFNFIRRLEERSIVMLLSAVIAFSAIFIAQVWMDSRQRRDHKLEIEKQEKQHKHDLQRERDAKLVEKKEELVRLVFEITLTLKLLREVCNGNVFLDTRMINSKPETQHQLVLINKKIYDYRTEINKSINLADHIVLTYFFKTEIHQIVEEQKDRFISLDNMFRKLLRDGGVSRNSNTVEADVIKELEVQAAALGRAVYKLALLQSPYTNLPLSCSKPLKKAA